MMIREAQAVHGVDQRSHVLRRGEAGNAMSEVEYMPAAFPEAGEDFGSLAFDDLGICQQNSGVEISLQRDAIADAPAGVTEVRGPVDAQRVGTTGSERFQPLPAAFGKYDARDPLPILLFLQTGTDSLDIG